MKILITGICGFVGSTLARAWLEFEPDLTIYGVDNFIRPGSECNRTILKRIGVKIYHCDIRVASDFDTLPVVDWVIDAAANASVLAGTDGKVSSRQLIEHNLHGTTNLLEYCKRCNAGFILLSTSRVYSIKPLAEIAVDSIGDKFFLSPEQQLPVGLSSTGVSETFSTAPPISLYGCTKLTSELLAIEYGDTFGFPVWCNRCGVLAGAGQFGRADQGIFSFWINSWIQRQPLTYLGFGGKGFQVRDCLHPKDLITLLRQQVNYTDKCSDRVVNLGGGEHNAISLLELSRWCDDRFGHHTVSKSLELRRYDIPWLIMDSTKAQNLWQWQPQTALYDILDEIALHADRNPNWLELSGNQ